MLPIWDDFLRRQGATLTPPLSVVFPVAAATPVKLIPLPQIGLLRFSGEESMPFLQGQLSSDVRKLDELQWQYSSYSTPKGRMLASFRLQREQGDYWLQLPSELLPALHKRLSMFILRSKTRAHDASGERLQLGLQGEQTATLLLQLGWPAPAPRTLALHDGLCILGLEQDRFQLQFAAEQLPSVWGRLVAAGAAPTGNIAWSAADIAAGVPWITAATQEAFVPQMANLELLDGVSFNKGCYPGQEIVARTQYLGKLKRRMYRAYIATDGEVAAGQEVFSPEMNGQASGQIMLAAPATGGGWEVLVVAQSSSLEHGLHWSALEGPPLQLLDLPYPLASA